MTGESEEFICCCTDSDVVATLANTGAFVEIAITALNYLNIWEGRVWSRALLVGPSEVSSCLDLIGCVTETWSQSYSFSPWIQTSRGLSCSTTAWTNSPRTSKRQCVSTQCPTLSTNSTRPSTASCRQGPLTALATSWAAPWLGWAPRAPPPSCPDTPPWGGSDPLSPARLCTITETTTPTWAASPSPAPSAPWRVAVWAAGRRAAVTGEEGGSSAATVSLNSAPRPSTHHRHITDTSPTHHRLTASVSASLLVTSECVCVSTKRDKSKLITEDTK